MPTNITLLLADRSHLAPDGLIEDMLIRVGNFIIPTDFIILDFEKNARVPVILGCHFLATGGALIDVKVGKMTMRVYDRERIFIVFKASSAPSHFEIYARSQL